MVKRPQGVELHFEVELAVVMGREVRDLAEGEGEGWMDAVDCKQLFFSFPPPFFFEICWFLGKGGGGERSFFWFGLLFGYKR